MKLSNIILYKDIKTNILAYLMLCGLLSLASSIEASALDEQCDAKNGDHYAPQQHYADQVSSIQEEAYLTIAEMPGTLERLIHSIDTHREVHLPPLLVLVTYDPTTQYYGKYLFVSDGLLASSYAPQKSPQLNDHLIKSPEGPVLWEVCSFLGDPKLALKQCILPKEYFCCLPCGHMSTHLLGDSLPKQKESYQGAPWPKPTLTTGVISAFYRPCLHDEERQLPITGYSKGHNFSHLISHSLNLTAPPLDCTWIFGSQDELPLYAIDACGRTSDILNVTNMTELIGPVSTVAAQHVSVNTTEETIKSVVACYLTTWSLIFVFVVLNYTPFTVRQKLLQAATFLIGATLHLLDLTLRIMS